MMENTPSVPLKSDLNVKLSSIYAVSAGLAFSLFWMLVGESWDLFGDALQYLAIHSGEPAEVPFGYRILTSYLAQLLPFSPKIDFAVVTLAALIFINVLIVVYSRLKNHSGVHTIIFSLLWLTSFGFVYYATTWIRADAPMLLLLTSVIVLSHYRAPLHVLALVFFLGILAHETMLIGVAMLWLDKIFKGNLTGGVFYSFIGLGILAIAAAAFYKFTRIYIPVEEATLTNYSTNLAAMFHYVLEYSNGVIKHVMRIYAAFGPALLFGLYYIVTQKDRMQILNVLVLLLITIAATFIATDTLRVMVIIFFPVLYYAANFFENLWQRNYRIFFFLGLLFQGLYSYIVYGHLRTFESSLPMTALAALLSVAAVILIAVVFFQTRNKKSSYTQI